MPKYLVALFFCLFGLVFPNLSLAQNVLERDSLLQNSQSERLDSLLNLKDSIPPTPVISEEESNEISRRNARLGQILSLLISRTKKYSIDLSKIRIDLNKPLDTLEMVGNMPDLKAYLTAMEAISKDTTQAVNSRFLTGMVNLLETFHEETTKYEGILTDRIESINEANVIIAEIKADSVLRLDDDDKYIVPELDQELNRLTYSIVELENTIFEQEIQLTRIQATISDLNSRFITLEQFFSQKKREVSRKSWNKEINFIWEKRSYDSTNSFLDILKKSVLTNTTISVIFLERSITSLLLIILVAGVFMWMIRSVLSSIKKEKEHNVAILARSNYFNKHLLSSCLVSLLPIGFLFFHNPPLALSSVLSFIFTLIATPLIKEHFPEKFYKLWVWFFALNLLSPTLGLNWDPYYDERYILLLCNILSILFGYLIYQHSKKEHYAGVKLVIFLAQFLILIEVFSAIMNILGRYNLSKIFTIVGISSFYRGIGLYVFTMVVLEAVYLWMESKKNANTITSFFDFKELEYRLSGFLKLIGFSIWAYGILFYSGYFDPIFNVVSGFLSKPRILGETDFTFGTIALFIGILVVSSFLANNIAYFFSAQDQKNATDRKNRLGSSILLIRLAIFTFGFIIAAAAAKIPLDKITLVLGALSVGIGFGLQTIINNLVSGIILAFERPIQIGDEIEVGQNAGTVKDVGIRASKIQAYDGSEIVVPNGDLLSQSLINWTLSDRKRRIELIIGVGYDSNMKTVKEILENVLTRDQILKTPKPKVLMQNFGDSSVDFRLLFWVESMDIWIDKRADVMSAIFEAFAENNIEIPYPKRDFYLKSVPESWENKPSSKQEANNPENNEES